MLAGGLRGDRHATKEKSKLMRLQIASEREWIQIPKWINIEMWDSVYWLKYRDLYITDGLVVPYCS